MQASRDDNFVPTLLGVSSVDLKTPVTVAVNPTTHRVLTDISGLASSMQKDAFNSTNGQTVFTATKTVAFDCLALFYLITWLILLTLVMGTS